MSFTADQFTPTKWNSAEDKARFANQFVAFVNDGFSEMDFPDWFYQRLSMCFGMIAHYDRSGFFGEFFNTLRDQVRFLRLCQEHPCYGDPGVTYSDVEKALREWLRLHGPLGRLQAAERRVIEANERAELARLKAKYEATS